MSGAVTLPVKIGEHPYSLVFKFGTMRLAEAEIGKSVFELMASGKLGANDLSAIFWASLQSKHRMTRDGSDDLIDAVGVEQVGEWLAEGLRKYFGKDAPEEAAEGDTAAGEPGKAVKKGKASPAS